MTDGDCEQLGPAGACASFDGLGGACACVLPCVTDADCAADRACLCRAAVLLDGEARSLISHTGCWPTSCRTDAECGQDATCALVNPEKTCVLVPQAACRRASDPCRSDTDCAAHEACELQSDAWGCGQSVCG